MFQYLFAEAARKLSALFKNRFVSWFFSQMFEICCTKISVFAPLLLLLLLRFCCWCCEASAGIVRHIHLSLESTRIVAVERVCQVHTHTHTHTQKLRPRVCLEIAGYTHPHLHPPLPLPLPANIGNN